MLKAVFFFILSFSLFFISAQGWLPVGARSMSLANTSVCLDDAWAYHHNPGALGALKQTTVGYSYENRFGLKELQYQGVAFAHVLKKGTISVGAQLFGNNLYRSNRMGLGYSLKLTDKLFAGVQLNYQTLRITNYLDKGTLTGELGILAKINEKVTFGIAVFNINRAKLVSFQDDRFSTYMRIGVLYHVSSKVLLLGEFEKELSSKLRPKGALEYEVSNRFFLRLGASGNPIELSFGAGYGLKNGLKLDLGSSWNQLLGWSPHFGLNYTFNKRK
jgi:hypothetical protein